MRVINGDVLIRPRSVNVRDLGSFMGPNLVPRGDGENRDENADENANADENGEENADEKTKKKNKKKKNKKNKKQKPTSTLAPNELQALNGAQEPVDPVAPGNPPSSKDATDGASGNPPSPNKILVPVDEIPDRLRKCYEIELKTLELFKEGHPVDHADEQIVKEIRKLDIHEKVTRAILNQMENGERPATSVDLQSSYIHQLTLIMASLSLQVDKDDSEQEKHKGVKSTLNLVLLHILEVEYLVEQEENAKKNNAEKSDAEKKAAKRRDANQMVLKQQPSMHSSSTYPILTLLSNTWSSVKNRMIRGINCSKV